jgi:hypothetical protein
LSSSRRGTGGSSNDSGVGRSCAEAVNVNPTSPRTSDASHSCGRTARLECRTSWRAPSGTVHRDSSSLSTARGGSSVAGTSRVRVRVLRSMVTVERERSLPC